MLANQQGKEQVQAVALNLIPAMIPAICPAALLAAGFLAALLGPATSAAAASAAGLGALLANDGSCFASIHLTALHLLQPECNGLRVGRMPGGTVAAGLNTRCSRHQLSLSIVTSMVKCSRMLQHVW